MEISGHRKTERYMDHYIYSQIHTQGHTQRQPYTTDYKHRQFFPKLMHTS